MNRFEIKKMQIENCKMQNANLGGESLWIGSYFSIFNVFLFRKCTLAHPLTQMVLTLRLCRHLSLKFADDFLVLGRGEFVRLMRHHRRR